MEEIDIRLEVGDRLMQAVPVSNRAKSHMADQGYMMLPGDTGYWFQKEDEVLFSTTYGMIGYTVETVYENV